MYTNDIREGSVIYYDGNLVKVRQVSRSKLCVAQRWPHPVLKVSKDSSLVYPAGLTAAILLINGWKKTSANIWHNEKYNDFNLSETGEGFYLQTANYNDICQVKYVHQLQNLFQAMRLTELNLNIP